HCTAIGAAVAVGVFTHADAVIAGAVIAQFVGVIHGLHHKQAAALVPGKGHGVDDVRLGHKQLQLKLLVHHGQGLGVFGAQGQLELGLGLYAAVVGNSATIFIGGLR